ncbi:MAG: sulfotransferase family protein [Pseudomonadota bacterium]
MRPNLFLVGAAKSGTTALAELLSEQPEIFRPHVKEPSWWSSDYRRGEATVKLESQADYDRLFAPARTAGARYALDASTSHLHSEVAIGRILAYRPDARFVVSLRDPVQMAHAFHMETLFNANEDVEDFETAWSLQAERAAGRRLPPACHEPAKLQYRTICAVGVQLDRLLSLAPRENVLVLFHQDLLDDPEAVWSRLLAFLDLPWRRADLSRQSGAAHFQRFPRLARLYQRPPPALGPAVRGGKRLLAATGTTSLAKRALARRGRRPPMRPEFEARLREAFAPEVERLQAATGRDLSAWKPARPAG